MSAQRQDKETALGVEMAKRTRLRTTPIDSSLVREYITGLGRQLASTLPETGTAWTFIPVYDDIHGLTDEPYALPDGSVFVSARLILKTPSEYEFAAMLAHAMAHVSGRLWPHPPQSAGTIPMVFFGGWIDQDRATVLLPAGLRQSIQENEVAADRIAVSMMAGADYERNPTPEFERIQEEVGRLVQARTDEPPHLRRPPSLYHP